MRIKNPAPTDFFVEELKAVEETNERLGKILNGKHEKADPEEICREQPKLNPITQDQLL